MSLTYAFRSLSENLAGEDEIIIRQGSILQYADAQYSYCSPSAKFEAEQKDIS